MRVFESEESVAVRHCAVTKEAMLWNGVDALQLVDSRTSACGHTRNAENAPATRLVTNEHVTDWHFWRPSCLAPLVWRRPQPPKLTRRTLTSSGPPLGLLPRHAL